MGFFSTLRAGLCSVLLQKLIFGAELEKLTALEKLKPLPADLKTLFSRSSKPVCAKLNDFDKFPFHSRLLLLASPGSQAETLTAHVLRKASAAKCVSARRLALGTKEVEATFAIENTNVTCGGAAPTPPPGATRPRTPRVLWGLFSQEPRLFLPPGAQVRAPQVN